MNFDTSSSPWLVRAASLLGVSAVVSVLAAALEARWVASQTGQWLSAFQANVGIVLLIGLGVALPVGLFSALLHGENGPLTHLRIWLANVEPEARARFSWLGPVGALALLMWLVLLAGVSTSVLARASSTEAAGVIMAGVAALLALTFGAAAWALVCVLAKAGAGITRFYWSWISAAVGFLAAFGVLIFVGTTSGQGHSFHALGVLRREELDLRAVGLLAMIGISAYVLPLRLRAKGAWMLMLACLVLTGGLATLSGAWGFRAEATTRGLERYAPLSQLALGPLRRLTDTDADGVSAWFGGGDCNDHDARINPHANDLPGNSVDEDCSGRDALRLEDAPKSVAHPPAVSPAGKLPNDLNVILITVDTLRADLGYLGYKRNLSPNLDKLAAKSIVYENAYSLASYTSKSLPQMLIGKYASETDLGFRHFNKFGLEDRFIPERLQPTIHTLSVQAYWYFHEPGNGFERGFKLIDARAAPKKHIIEGDQTSNGDELTDNALELLKNPAHTKQRFYMWVHYVDPHAEFVPHSKFDFGHLGRERYDGEVAFVDDQLGRLFDFVEHSEFGKRTAIVFTSDHGEAFGEHGMYRHGFELWEELVRVPLLIYVPGLAPRRVRERRSTIDVAPTLLDLFHLAAPSGQGTDFMSGQSLIDELFTNPERPRPVLIDMSAGPYNEERRAFIDQDMKLILSEGKVLGLYDLARDPGEKQDLSANSELKEKALARFGMFKKRLREVPLKRQAK